MRKLVITCECGQRMQVPRTAIGKAGLCPSCGATVPITSDSARPYSPSGRTGLVANAQHWWRGSGEPPEEAKRLFGRAADLFYARHYGEALAIFNSLARQYPGNPDIESGRIQCMKALRQPQDLALEYKGNGEAKLDAETVKKVVLNKMLHGSTEAIQLQAAELAAQILGLTAVESQAQQTGQTTGAVSAADESLVGTEEAASGISASDESDPADTNLGTEQAADTSEGETTHESGGDS